jgi:hypothetical protein
MSPASVARARPLPLIVRDAEAGRFADLFLVCAVVTVLGIRGLLAATGYPQLGGGRLHIAHLLWGGLALALALGIALLSLNRRVKPLAALIGGAGFGCFIDELGKFLTRDNDYFYRPTIALIYFVFVLIYLATRWLVLHRPLTTDENLANAITLLKDVALQDLDAEEKARAAAHLDRCDAADPRVPLVRGFLERLIPIPPPPPAWHQRLGRRLAAGLERLLEHPAFPRALSLVFVAQALFAVAWTVFTARALWLGWRDPLAGSHLERGFSEWARLASTVVSAGLAWTGVTRLFGAPERAYRNFRQSLLVAILVTQFFVFYRAQLEGILGLSFNLALLGGVQHLLGRERGRAVQQAAAAAAPGTP